MGVGAEGLCVERMTFWSCFYFLDFQSVVEIVLTSGHIDIPHARPTVLHINVFASQELIGLMVPMCEAV